MSTQIERLQFYTDSGMALACAEVVQLASEIDSLKAKLAQVEATAERRLGLLRKCMWIPAKAGPWCPGCERLQEFGHKPDCPLAREIASK